MIITIVSLLLSTVMAAEPQQAIFGDWVIVRELSAASDAKLSGDEIESLIGASAHYEKMLVNFAGEQCQRPIFDSYRETAHSLLQTHELQAEDLRLSTEVPLAVEIGCADGDEEFEAGTWLLLAAPDRLITEVDGVYFEMKRLAVTAQ